MPAAARAVGEIIASHGGHVGGERFLDSGRPLEYAGHEDAALVEVTLPAPIGPSRTQWSVVELTALSLAVHDVVLRLQIGAVVAGKPNHGVFGYAEFAKCLT